MKTKTLLISQVKPLLIAAMLVPIMLLSGCGSEDDNSTPVIDHAPISAIDGFNVIMPGELVYVDLSNLIESGTAGANVTNVYFESSQGSGQCGLVDNSGSSNGNTILGLGFNVIIDGTAICEYIYEVESVAVTGQTKTSASATIMLASSADGDAVLPPISIAMAIDDLTLTTDIETALGDDFPTGYILSEGFSILGDGTVVMDADNFTVSYTPEAVGVSRVVYSLEGEIDDVADIKIGTLDYAISDSLNNGPTATNFRYDPRVEIEEQIDIDVAGNIEDDEDSLQLIDVNSYTAIVASKNPNELTNTVFTFEAPTDGLHYVSYTVSDQRGGFATAMVEVESFDASQYAVWSDIENDSLLFRAPKTQQEMDDSSEPYQGISIETDYEPSISMATFISNGAESFCSYYGRLPTAAEMESLYNNQSPSEKLWPTGKDYIALDEGVFSLYSLQEGGASAIGDDFYYVTCIDTGGLVATMVKPTATANGTDTVEIEVNYTRATGPVAGAVLGISIPGSSTATPSSSTIITDDDGDATIFITNTVAETVTVNIEHDTFYSVEPIVTFIADLTTALIDELEVVSDNALADGISKNEFQLTLLDAYNNPVPQALIAVSFDSTAAQLVETESTLLTGTDGLLTFNITDVAVETVNTTATFTRPDDVEVTASAQSDFVNIFEYATFVVTHNNTANTGFSVHYNTVLLTLKDASGDLITGSKIDFEVSGDASVEATAGQTYGVTDDDGQITVKIYDTSIETVDVIANSGLSQSITASVSFSTDLTEYFVTTEQSDGKALGTTQEFAEGICNDEFNSSRLPTAEEFTALMNQSLGPVLGSQYGWPNTANVYFLADKKLLGNMNLGKVVDNNSPGENRFLLCHL